MESEALEIIAEYLESRDARLRMNAATALNALESPEGAERLLRVAIEDEHGEVRVHALDELRVAKVLPVATAYLSASLRHDEYSGRTSWVLGDLRGLDRMTVPRLAPYRVRQRADLRTTQSEVTAATWRPRRGQLLLWGLIGGTGASCILFGVIRYLAGQSGLMEEVLGGLLSGGLLVGPPLAWVVARKVQPLWNRHDRVAAFVSELWWCAVGVAFAGIPWAVLMALAAIAEPAPSKFASWRVLVAFVLLSTISVMTARMGAMLCQGFGAGWAQRVGGCLLAGMAAMVTVTLATQVLVFSMASAAPDLVKEFWMMLLPVGFGVGLACCVVESAHRSSRNAAQRRRWPAAAALGIVVAIVVGYVGSALRSARVAPAYVSRIVADGQRLSREMTIKSVPSTIHLDVKTRQSVQVDAPLGENPDFVVQLFSTADGGRMLIKDWDDPPSMVEALEPGAYDVVVTTYPAARQTRAALGVSAVYAMVLDREFWSRRRSPDEMKPLAESKVHVTTGLPFGFNPNAVPVPSVETTAGTVRIGGRVRFVKPANAEEGPAWVDGMTGASGQWLTVKELVRRQDFTEVKVNENTWIWDSRWISEVSPPAAGR